MIGVIPPAEEHGATVAPKAIADRGFSLKALSKVTEADEVVVSGFMQNNR